MHTNALVVQNNGLFSDAVNVLHIESDDAM